MFNSGSFTSSTPIYKEDESGFYENSPQSGNSSQITSDDYYLDPSCFPKRKNLFGKRRVNENTDCLFSNKQKFLLSRSSTFSRRGSNSNKETPRTSRIYTGADRPVLFPKTEEPWRPWLSRTSKQLAEDDSGFCSETPERSGNSNSPVCSKAALSRVIENLHKRKENSQKESPAYLKDSLDFSGAKYCDDLSTSELFHLYSIYRFQRMGIKPSAADNAFHENNLMDEESEMVLLSWKETLECISADVDKESKIDFLRELDKMNAHSIVSNILSYLSGSDLQNASRVDGLWRKLILEDKAANMARCIYLMAERMIRKEKKKNFNPFQRPMNFRILGSIGNIQNQQLHLKKTNKEINFEAFMQIGKSGENHKPMKCPSCANLSLNNKQVITKYNCVFCGYEFCCNCLKPYTNWHFCASSSSPAEKPSTNGKKYLRRL